MPLIQLTDVTVFPQNAALRPEKRPGMLRRMFFPPKGEFSDGPPQPILDALTLTIRARETLAILGPSGAGKTTLLRIAAGLIKPYSGSVTYNQKPVNEVHIRERRIGMIFQGQALYQNMTSEENIGFYHAIRHQSEEIPRRIRDVSRLMDVDLGPLLSRRPPKLSGGENQRVAIARALARDVDIFLFDEPLSNLDAKLREHLRRSMKRIFNMYPVTTLYVTHDQSEAMAVADRIAILREGHLEQIGPAMEIFARPNNVFVADFLGRCNLLPGKIRDGRWVYNDLSLQAPPTRAREGNQITLGIRPGDFIPDENGPLMIQVLDTTPLLDRHIIQVDGFLEGQRITADMPIGTEIGEWLRASVEKVFWFDTASGQRLRI
jgi:multiple sugar transport system ATP-binding protein